MRQSDTPPSWMHRLLRLYCHEDYLDEVEGDLLEVWRIRQTRMPRWRANLLFIKEVIQSIKHYTITGDKNSYPSDNQTIMIRNYLTIGLRNILKNKLSTFINVLGLSVAMACTILIFLFVANELSYDRFHANFDSIYRLNETVLDESGMVTENSASMPWSVGPAIVNDYPDMPVTRMYQAWQKDPLIIEKTNDKKFYEQRLFFVDTSFFDIFTFPIVKGDAATPLDRPQSVVISQSTATRYFGDQDPIGKTLWLEDKMELTVTAVTSDAPANSHFHFDFLIPLLNLEDLQAASGSPWGWQGWYWNPVHTYLIKPDNLTKDDLETYFSNLVKNRFPESIRNLSEIKLQPLANIHFTTNLYQEIEPNRSRESLHAAMVIAIFILSIAAINFINLSTAAATKRAKEVALRKVMGSSRYNLIFQFYGESIIICLISLCVSIILAYLFLPAFQELVGTTLNLDNLINPKNIGLAFGGSLLLGVAAGTYPAFQISNFQPIKVLKSKITTGDKTSNILRKALVTFQFTTSIVLLISAFVVYTQHDYLVSKSLGFDKDRIVYIPIQGSSIKGKIEEFKNELNENTSVMASSAMSDILGRDVPIRPFGIDGIDEPQQIPGLFTDHDFIKTFGVEMIEGRDFDKSNEGDALSILINEEMLSILIEKDWEGQEISFGPDRKIIGLVKNFNYMDLRQPVRPLIIGFSNNFLGYIAARVTGNNIYQSINEMERTWKKFEPSKPFVPFFLSDKLSETYASEAKTGHMVGYFTLLAILIALLGLIGLVNHTVNAKVREIGIRKVLGASISSVTSLLSKEFMILIVIANIIAWPVAWFFMNIWLQDFNYRIDLSWWIFAGAGLLIMFIGGSTTFIRSFRAARMNPIDTIKEE